MSIYNENKLILEAYNKINKKLIIEDGVDVGLGLIQPDGFYKVWRYVDGFADVLKHINIEAKKVVNAAKLPFNEAEAIGESIAHNILEFIDKYEEEQQPTEYLKFYNHNAAINMDKFDLAKYDSWLIVLKDIINITESDIIHKIRNNVGIINKIKNVILEYKESTQ